MSNHTTSRKKPDDSKLADLWLEKYPQTKYGLGAFRRYQSGIWPEISDNAIKKEILETLEGATKKGVRPSLSLLKSVYELARVKNSVPDELWDSNPNILVCRNVTLDLSTHTPRPHSPDDLATSALPYDYDPDAQAPNWFHALSQLPPDVSSFSQEYAGYSLTTDTKFEICVWFVGPPGSGKSTIISGFQVMTGSKSMILRLSDIQNQFGLSDMVGKTLAIATEIPSTKLAATDRLNSIISGEKTRIERKHKDSYEIIPHVKMLWAMNDIPRINSNNDGLLVSHYETNG